MTVVYFENASTGKRFKVLRWNRETGEITLKGVHAEFTEKYEKERFAKLGYRIVKEETTDA